MDKFLYVNFFLITLVVGLVQCQLGNPTTSVQVQQVQGNKHTRLQGAEIPKIPLDGLPSQSGHHTLQQQAPLNQQIHNHEQPTVQQQQLQQILQEQQLQQQRNPQIVHGNTRLPSIPEIQHDTSQIDRNTISRLEKEVLRVISDGSERFALELFNEIIKEKTATNYNFILSPFSAWSLIVLLVEGSGGRTLEEIERVLGLPNNIAYVRDGYRQIRNALHVNTSTMEISTTHVMFSDINSTIYPDFQQTIQRLYRTDVISVNYLPSLTAAKIIHGYVSRATQGRIQQILKKGDLIDASMILISAIYVRGQWRSAFNASETAIEPFYDEYGNTQGRVNMMFQRGSFPYTAIADLDAHILELPYGNLNRFSMIILLPRKGVPLSQVVEKLATVRLQRVFDELKKAADEYEDNEVEVYLPRFNITADFLLNCILEKMGVMDVFSPLDANLSNITNTQMYLSRLIHKATIEVNEEGVASAVTAGVFTNNATLPRFYANRPFAFLIVDKITNILLFCGHVKNPKTFYV